MSSLDKIKKEWNYGLRRVKKAEELAEKNPKLFEMYIDEFKKLCREMSKLMQEYQEITGSEIPEKTFLRGFEIKLK